MRISKQLKALGRRGRAILLPISDVPTHLSFLTQYTAKKLGFEPEIIQLLEESIMETCQDAGLVTTRGERLEDTGDSR